MGKKKEVFQKKRKKGSSSGEAAEKVCDSNEARTNFRSFRKNPHK